MSEVVESSGGVSDAELVSMAASLMGGSAPAAPAKAVNEALAADQGDTQSDEEAPAEEAPAAKKAATQPDVNPDTIIRSRMERARAAKAAKAEARREAERAYMQRQYEEMQRKTVEERPSFDVDGFRSKLKSSPIAALQELGIDINDFTSAALEEGTPQAKMMAQMRSMQEKLDQIEREKKELTERQSKMAAERQRQQDEADFCAMITPQEYPSLYAIFEERPQALVREAYNAINEFVSRGGNPDDITDEQVADYLERVYSRAADRVRGKAQARLGTQPAPVTSKPRTPSQARASETGSGKRDFHNLSSEEQDAMLVEVARQAMSNAN